MERLTEALAPGTRFFEGLEIVDAGIAAAEEWHPELGEPVPGQDGVHSGAYVAVARRA